jgi:hypothetical protein
MLVMPRLQGRGGGYKSALIQVEEKRAGREFGASDGHRRAIA